MKYALITAAGLAITAGASAQSFSFAGPATLAGGQSVQIFSGNLSGSLTNFNFSFNYGEPVGDSSWASDMAIDIMDPNGNIARIGGFDAAGFAPVYDGAVSDLPSNYGDNIALSGLSGSGIWTVTVTNDWGGDPNANTISNFDGTLGGLVPTPGALALFGIAGLAATRRRR